jgi:hypothetical protein
MMRMNVLMIIVTVILVAITPLWIVMTGMLAPTKVVIVTMAANTLLFLVTIQMLAP